VANQKKEKTNTVFIGDKQVMKYVLSTIIQLKNNPSEVNIKARGKFISKAVDVAEIVRKRYTKGLKPKIKDIKIDTEKYKKEEKEIKISTIKISLTKQDEIIQQT